MDNSLLVRALDRFYRRLLATDRLVPQLKIIERASAIIAQCGHERALFYFDGLKRHFSGIDVVFCVHSILVLISYFGPD